MNMLELQLLVVISGVPGRIGPTLIDSQQGLVADRLVPAPAKLSASPDHLPPQSA